MTPEGSRQALAAGSVLQETYRIVRRIGRGGMGEVYEATHARLSGRYAIKVLLGEIATSDEALARFRREAEVTSSLRHPNIVQVMDFNRTPQGDPYLVMEFLEGRELAAELGAEPRQPVARTAEILRQTVSGLTAAHNRGIVHRDLKPENLFLARVEGEEHALVKILDFGISKVREATTRLTRESAVIGTVHYMAPEQALGEIDRIDARSDQFSLACITYEMLAGREPFWGDSLPAVIYQVVHKDPAPLEDANREVTPALAEVVRRGMAKDPAARFPSVRDFHGAFAAAAGLRESAASAARPAVRPTAPTQAARPAARSQPTTFSSTTGETLPGRPGRARRSAPWIAGAAVAVAVVGLLVVARGSHRAPAPTFVPPVAAAPPPAPPAPAPPAPPVEVRPAAPAPVVTVQVQGVPAGAQVTLDGEAVRLPLQLPREQRSHLLRISAAGFEPLEQPVSATADGTVTVSLKKARARRKPAPAPAPGQMLLDL